MDISVPSRVRTPLLAARRSLLRHVHGEGLMLGLAAFIGAGTGALAAVLVALLLWIQDIAWGDTPGRLHIMLVPVLGAFAVGLFVTYVAPETGGSGIGRTMETIALRGGRFRGRTPFAGIVSSGIALGTGAAGGREGPIVLIGGSLGSIVGRFFAVDEDRLRTLVSAGAAAGIGASFNAPIGGMLFAIELLMGGFRARSFQTIVVASVAGSVTARQLIGPDVVFRPTTTYHVNDPRELLLYGLLGLAAVLVGLGFLYGEDLAKRFFAGLDVWPPLRLALGGLGLGIVALGMPEVLGTGEHIPPVTSLRDPVQSMLNGEIGVGYAAAGFLLLLAVAKLVATCLSIGSGNAIGTFMPVIFVGAALGGSVGHVADQLLPAANVQPGAFALVGMAAAFGAAARAPLTAIVIIFEVTGDYELVLPLMLATGLATFLADRFSSESVYTKPLRNKGIVYAEPDDVDIMQTVRVEEVMTRRADTVAADLPLDDLRERFRRSGHHGFPVVREGDRLVGVVTLADVERFDASASASAHPPRRVTVEDVCTRDVVTVVPTDPVFRGLRRMAALDVGRIPVVAAEDHGRLVGLLRRSDLVQAYQHAVARTVRDQHRDSRSHLRDMVGVRFVEIPVEPGSAVDGTLVREISWPPSTVLTSVRRRGDVIVPRGDTVLEGGDEIVAITGQASLDDLRALLRESKAEQITTP